MNYVMLQMVACKPEFQNSLHFMMCSSIKKSIKTIIFEHIFKLVQVQEHN